MGLRVACQGFKVYLAGVINAADKYYIVVELSR